MSGHTGERLRVIVLALVLLVLTSPVGAQLGDDAPRLQAILDAHGRLELGAQTYRLGRALVVGPTHQIIGQGNKRSILRPDPGVSAIVARPAVLSEGPLQLRDFAVIGRTDSSPDLITIRNVAGIELRGLWVRNTAATAIRIDGPAYNIEITNTRIEDAATAGVWLHASDGDSVNVWRITNTEFQSNDLSATFGLFIDRAGWGTVQASTFEGNGRVLFGVMVTGTSCVEISNSFFEHYRDAAIAFEWAPSGSVAVLRNHLHPRIDTNGHRLEHVDLDIRQNRFP